MHCQMTHNLSINNIISFLTQMEIPLFPLKLFFYCMISATTQPAVCGPEYAGSWSARPPSNSNTSSTLLHCAHPEEGWSSPPDEFVAVIPTASHPDNMCLPASCLSQLTRGMIPKAFLWVYEGLAVACRLPEEEAGREQPSSDCSPGATVLY